jgi:hypothetical protein
VIWPIERNVEGNLKMNRESGQGEGSDFRARESAARRLEIYGRAVSQTAAFRASRTT